MLGFLLICFPSFFLKFWLLSFTSFLLSDYCAERLCSRIPAAVGLLCVGFWRRVGVNTVFPAYLFFYFFIFFCSRINSIFLFFVVVKTAFFIDVEFLYPLSIFANFDYFLPNNSFYTVNISQSSCFFYEIHLCIKVEN